MKRAAPARCAVMPRMRPKPSGVIEVVLARRPAEPLHCLRPAVFAEAARRFVAGFPGEVLYAVKCNPQEAVLKALRAGGIRRFDAASLPEVQLIHRLFPHDSVHFMHPVKPRSAIRAAFHQHGVRDFALDSSEELAKILAETQAAGGLGLLVRLALPAGGAARWDLSGKFGAQPAQAAALL
ncbi:MAG: type III PLP-dependent enzyme, partial [Alphaproteobacteria bacterium]|nr:type III PLP-dependent enzyme [Alphaproteobacteria bacterium]